MHPCPDQHIASESTQTHGARWGRDGGAIGARWGRDRGAMGAR